MNRNSSCPLSRSHTRAVWSKLADRPRLASGENPTPQTGTNNWYTQDGYGAGSFGSPSSGGGTYSECTDTSAAGVGQIVRYLRSLPRAWFAFVSPSTLLT